jgi:hypothetical protein
MIKDLKPRLEEKMLSLPKCEAKFLDRLEEVTNKTVLLVP